MFKALSRKTYSIFTIYIRNYHPQSERERIMKATSAYLYPHNHLKTYENRSRNINNSRNAVSFGYDIVLQIKDDSLHINRPNLFMAVYDRIGEMLHNSNGLGQDRFCRLNADKSKDGFKSPVELLSRIGYAITSMLNSTIKSANTDKKRRMKSEKLDSVLIFTEGNHISNGKKQALQSEILPPEKQQFIDISENSLMIKDRLLTGLPDEYYRGSDYTREPVRILLAHETHGLAVAIARIAAKDGDIEEIQNAIIFSPDHSRHMAHVKCGNNIEITGPDFSIAEENKDYELFELPENKDISGQAATVNLPVSISAIATECFKVKFPGVCKTEVANVKKSYHPKVIADAIYKDPDGVLENILSGYLHKTAEKLARKIASSEDNVNIILTGETLRTIKDAYRSVTKNTEFFEQELKKKINYHLNKIDQKDKINNYHLFYLNLNEYTGNITKDTGAANVLADPAVKFIPVNDGHSLKVVVPVELVMADEFKPVEKRKPAKIILDYPYDKEDCSPDRKLRHIIRDKDYSLEYDVLPRAVELNIPEKLIKQAINDQNK
jgi:hypothetical protein